MGDVMDFLIDNIPEPILVIFFVVLIGFGLAVSVSVIGIKYFDNVPIVVVVDGKEVYSGISAGANVDSSGANTTVTIKGGFLYWFPKAYYVSKNVEIVGDKRK